MKSTKAIHERLQECTNEVKRISDFIHNHPEKQNMPYTMPSGLQHPTWTWNDSLISAVSKKMTLKWVLNIHS